MKIKLTKNYLKQLIKEEVQLLTESTRSYIAIPTKDSRRYIVTYCHWDGYPEGVGKILKRYWFDPNKIKELIKLGKNGISVLGKMPGQKINMDNTQEHDKAIDNKWCIFYGRDRGKTDPGQWIWNIDTNNIDKLIQRARQSWVEYIYLYNPKNKQWSAYKVSTGKQVRIP